jgi:hypothetical protein
VVPNVPRGGGAQTKDALIGAIKTAVSAVQAKSPSEVEAYKEWLILVARDVARASKEGGFLGIGGTEVSRDEERALDQLSELLGVTTGTRR